MLSLLITSCNETEEFLPPEFNYPIPQENITEPVWVGTFYYYYSPEDWNEKYTFTPKLGEYDATDNAVMSQHIDWALQGGIDYFIFHWNGAEDNTLLNTFVSNNPNNLKMVIDYNLAHLKATNSSPLEGAKLTTMLDELKILFADYATKDYYLTVDNRPVILINSVNLSSKAATSVDFGSVVPAVRSELNTTGVNPYIIGEITSGWLPPQRYSISSKSFDAVVLSDWKPDGNYGYDRSVFFPAYIDQAFSNWNDSTNVWGIDFVPCIIPGFDDKTTSPSSKVFNVERSVEFYADMCNVAKRNLSSSRIIMIDSWNDFKMGTTIEPTTEYDDDYLMVTKNQFTIQ